MGKFKKPVMIVYAQYHDTMLALLKTSKCPSCDGGGAYYDDIGEVCQCQWCDEKKRIIDAACNKAT